MDVNGTKFHLLYGKEDWQGNNTKLPRELDCDNPGVCLTLKPLMFCFPISTTYLFCWDEIPGKDNEKLLDFINKKFNIIWKNSMKIEKIDNIGIIKVYDEENVISLRLNKEQNGINTEINEELSYKLIVKKENGKLNIYSIIEGMVTPSDRRGADIDRYDNLYWIDGNRQEIRILNSGSRTPSHFWSSYDLNDECKKGDFQNEKKESHETLLFSGLAVTENHYLIVGVLSPPGFLVFDLLIGGSPVQRLWKKEEDFTPFDMAKVPGGGVLILDKEHKKCHLLDRYLRLASCERKIDNPYDSDFIPEEVKSRKAKNPQITTYQNIENSYSIDAQYPVSVAAISGDSFVVLDSDHDAGYSALLFYKKGQLVLKFLLDHILDDFIGEIPDKKQSHAILGHDIAFIPDGNNRIPGKLYLAATDGNQAYAFEIKEIGDDFVVRLLPRYYPMRLFSGKALVSDGKNAYYDLKENWLRIIEQPVPIFARKGVLTTNVFDGKEINCVWHRIFLDAHIPQGASVRVESKTANEVDGLSYLEWQEEPSFHMRGNNSELPYFRAYPEKQKIDGQGTWEFLFQRAVGRYLVLRLTIEGTGTNSPALRALRIHYPRFSYMKKYLPSIYQDDSVSASFLDRYLANIEGTYTEIEGKIQNAEMLFDVNTVPSEYLGWLAGWFGIILNSDWEDMRKRLFLSHAVSLFRERGTISGLLRTIRLFTDPCPDETIFETDPMANERIRESVRIVEKYRLRKAPGVVYGDPLDAQGPGVTTDTSIFRPVDGAVYVHKKFTDYLGNSYQINGKSSIDALNRAWGTDYKSFEMIKFSPTLPQNLPEANDWKFFLKNRLGFMYAEVSSDHLRLYWDFLKKRYRKIKELNRIYHSDRKLFEDIPLPITLPEDENELSDWIQFVSNVLPIRLNAHRFIVLVPEKPDESEDVVNKRIELIRRIVEIEKPAHTRFEIKPYFSLLRVGEARLGIDTELGKSCRFTTLLLGKSRLEEGAFESHYPGDLQPSMYARD